MDEALFGGERQIYEPCAVRSPKYGILRAMVVAKPSRKITAVAYPLACLLWLCSACSDPTLQLVVDLRTDLAPGVEFDEISLLFAGHDVPTELDGSMASNYVEGARLHSGVVSPDTTIDVRITLLLQNREVISRHGVVEMQSTSRVVTLMISRDCRGVSCPGSGDPTSDTCLAGQCINPQCTPETPQFCPAPLCAESTDCPSASGCTVPLCTAGVCFVEADSARCASGEFCHPEDDCQPRAGADGGLSDAGLSDAGLSDTGLSDTGLSDVISDAGPTPDVPRIRSPWNGVLTGSLHTPPGAADHPLRPRFRWDLVVGADQYQIQLTPRCNVEEFLTCAFSEPTIDTTTSALEYRAARLEVATTAPVGTRYYWRLRACALSRCGDWSAVRYLDVGRVARDYNGDGYSDLAVGAPSAGTIENVLVYYGNADAFRIGAGELSLPDLRIANPSGEAPARFGSAVASAGDVNADGFADLAVGAYNAASEGRVYAYYGDATGLLGTPSIELSNPDAQDGRFGFSVAGADLNGDGYSELAVGAYWQSDGALREGNVFVYSGSAAGLGPTPAQIDSPHNRANGEFGVDLEDAGDVDGDGVSDLVVGAWLEEEVGVREGGRVYLFSGGRTGVGTTPGVELANPLNQPNGQFGVSVAAADLNDDGFPDIVVGAPLQNNPEEGEGVVYVFFGDGEGINPSPGLTIDNPADQPLG